MMLHVCRGRFHSHTTPRCSVLPTWPFQVQPLSMPLLFEACSFGINTWVFSGNAEFLTPLHTYCIRVCILTRSPGYLYVRVRSTPVGYFYTKLKTEEIFVRLSVALSASIFPLSNCLLGNLPGKQNPGFCSLGTIHSSTLIPCSSVSSSQVPGIIFLAFLALDPTLPHCLSQAFYLSSLRSIKGISAFGIEEPDRLGTYFQYLPCLPSFLS